MRHCELLIIGAGAAGIAAAVAAWDSGCRSIVLIDRGQCPGGVLLQCLHEGFGLSTFGEELTGPDYAARLAEKLKNTGVQILTGTEAVAVEKEKVALLSGRGGFRPLGFDRLILAAGCRERTIGGLPVTGTRPAGIFTAGQAQACINLRHQSLGEHVLILGGGDLGMIMARRFTLEGKQVIAVIEQGESCSGMARNYRRCIEAYHIPVITHSTITEIHGESRLRGVTLSHLDSGEEEYLPCDTLVTALGLVPERELVNHLGEPDWLFLAGNCSRIHDIVDSAVAEAEQAGKAAALGQ